MKREREKRRCRPFLCSAEKLVALRASLKIENELMSPLRLVTLPHSHMASPRAVVWRVALLRTLPEDSSSSEAPPTAWLEEEGGVTSRVRTGFPQVGPNPTRHEVKF